MLRKMLRYDLRAVFKYWWIGAVAMFGVLFLSSFVIKPLKVDDPAPVMIVIGVIVFILTLLCIAAFYLLSGILNFAHFYKNQFTDQGYLTFTLPVKRSTLLNSKLYTGVITTIATAVVTAISIGVVALIGFHQEIFDPKMWKDIIDGFKEIWEECAIFIVISAIESIVLFLLSVIFSNLFMFTCITVGAIIARKLKLLAAIGTYYVANGIFGSVVSITYMCALPALTMWLNQLPSEKYDISFMLIGLLLILAMAILCTVMYTFQLYLTDKKLNLA